MKLQWILSPNGKNRESQKVFMGNVFRRKFWSENFHSVTADILRTDSIMQNWRLMVSVRSIQAIFLERQHFVTLKLSFIENYDDVILALLCLKVQLSLNQ